MFACEHFTEHFALMYSIYIMYIIHSVIMPAQKLLSDVFWLLAVLFQALMRYKSWLHRVMETFTFSPMLLLGSTEQKQALAVPIFENYQEDPVST